MKNWIKSPRNRFFLGILLIITSFNIIATLTENPMLLIFSKPIIIPALALYYFVTNKQLRLVFAVFLTLSFFGDLSSVIFNKEDLIKVSSLAYALSYVCLVIFIISKFRRVNFNALIGLYLVVLFAINAYFLYVIFSVLKLVIPDQIEVVLFVLKSISLLLLAILAFALYLNEESKKSIILLVASLSFVFSDTLQNISYYYIYDWSFVMLDRVLYIVGVFLLLSYNLKSIKVKKERDVLSKSLSQQIGLIN